MIICLRYHYIAHLQQKLPEFHFLLILCKYSLDGTKRPAVERPEEMMYFNRCWEVLSVIMKVPLKESWRLL